MGVSRERGHGGKKRASSASGSGSGSDSDTSSGSGDEGGQQSWVLCDRCTKWRRIPSAFARKIGEDTQW